MVNMNIDVGFIVSILCLVAFLGVLFSGILWTRSRGPTKTNKHELKVPYHKPAAFDYKARQRETDLLHTAAIIYAGDAIEPDEAVDEANYLMKAVGQFLEKERNKDNLSIAKDLSNLGKMKPL